MRILTFVLVLALGGAGCRDSAEPEAPEAEAAKIPAPSAEAPPAEAPSAEAPSEEAGSAAPEPVSIPEGYPDDVPTYPNTSPEVVEKNNNLLITTKTEDSPKAVFEFYRDRLKSDGWAIAAEVREGADQTLSAMRGGEAIIVAIRGDGSSTEVRVVVAVREAAAP